MSRFRKAICNDQFGDREIADVFHYVGELGYDGVELNPYMLSENIRDLSPAQRQDIRRMAKSAGVEIIGLHSILKTDTGFYYFNHPDASVRAETVEHLNDLIVLCGDLGGEIIVLGASKKRNIWPGVTFQQAWDYAVEVFKGSLEAAGKYGVMLCLEPLTHLLTDFITQTSDAVRMVEEISHPNFRMMLDVRSASHDAISIPDQIRQSARHLTHFHANDDNGKGPGAGNADYAAIAAALREINYDGYLSVEVFDFQPDPETIAKESLDTLKRYFGPRP
ncbi:sugar phosphate isomerase/epimerase family protein [Candidatus Poribacteria bacterium]